MITSIIFSLIIFAIAGALIVFLLLLKNKSEETEDQLMKNIYIYFVLFATLMMSIGGSVGVFMAVADMISPAPYYQSFEEYKELDRYERKEFPEKEAKSEEELKLSYDAMVEREIMQSKHRAMNTMIKSFGWIIIPLPVFLFFQRRLAKKP